MMRQMKVQIDRCRTLPLEEMLHVNPQLAAELDYDRNILHGYVNQNLPRFNICQEIIIIAMFNVVTQGEGAVFFLDGLGGSGKTFVYNVLLALVRRDEHVAIGVTSSGITVLLWKVDGPHIQFSRSQLPLVRI
jgi:hypothetical protein